MHPVLLFSLLFALLLPLLSLLLLLLSVYFFHFTPISIQRFNADPLMDFLQHSTFQFQFHIPTPRKVCIQSESMLYSDYRTEMVFWSRKTFAISTLIFTLTGQG